MSLSDDDIRKLKAAKAKNAKNNSNTQGGLWEFDPLPDEEVWEYCDGARVATRGGRSDRRLHLYDDHGTMCSYEPRKGFKDVSERAELPLNVPWCGECARVARVNRDDLDW